MNIKIASERTGLTKKAIKYYESVGLINPSKNNYNNYREYIEKDIMILNLIGSLRFLDISICDIKLFIDGDKQLKDILKDTLKKVDESIINLQRSRSIICNVMQNNVSSKCIEKEIKKIREIVQYSVSEKKEYVYNKLLKIFPGNFGKAIVSTYEPFLNINIDSNEKENAFIKLVEILDDIDENFVDVKYLENVDNKVVENGNEIKENIYNILIKGETEKENQKNNIVNFIKNIYKNKDIKKQFIENTKIVENIFNSNTVKTNEFDKYLEILSDDYKKYKNILNDINKEVDIELKKDIGFTREEFFKMLLK